LQIYGVTFNGIQEIKRIAFGSGYYKRVYVGVDSQSYPCFDSWDYANESRWMGIVCDGLGGLWGK